MQSPGLYVHIPFCSAVCPYCDFAVTVGGAERRARFVAALHAEIALGAPAGFPGPIDTIYLGGGTPSLLEPADLGGLLEAIAAHLPLAEAPWISMEVNPEDATPERLAAWRELGVRTVSLGVQSFDERALAYLGRRHSCEEAVASIERARAAGFDTVSVDLIYGLPDSDEAGWRRDLDRAVGLAPDHLSCYQLTIDRRTPFGVRRRRGELIELPEELQGRLFRETHRRLAAAGFDGYEVSNFAAAPRHRSRHNGKYWDHTPYLGLGPSAHSFDGRRRWWNERPLADWLRAIESGARPEAGSEDLGPGALALERLMLGLRTAEGVDLDELRERYGFDLEAARAAELDRLVAAGTLLRDGRRLRPTLDGLAVADTLARELGPDAD